MKKYFGMLGRKVLPSFSLVTCILAVGLLDASVALADGGIAISGSFYQQSFEVPQGSSISGPDVYVVVFNNSSEQLKVKMTSQTPPGVRLVLSQNEFTLPASGQKQIQVGVEVGTDAVPGGYEIIISAESYKDAVTGIQLVGAASQKASLTVLGESGMVSVQATSPDRQPIAAIVRLYRVISGQEREVAYSKTGNLEAKVAPGSFVATSYVGGIKLAEERFEVAAGGSKNIILSGATVYFEGFDVVPNYQKVDGKLAFVQIVYTVNNLYQRVEKGEVLLQVSYNGGSPTEILMATLTPLEIGRAGLSYNYIPSGNWTDGSYEFKLQLNLDGKPYATSPAERLAVSDSWTATGETSPTANGGGITWDIWGGDLMSNLVIGGTAVAVVVVLGILIFVLRRSRR